MTNAEVATSLARKLIALGDDHRGKCRRVQFMVSRAGVEHGSGGMCEEALARFFTEFLDDIQPPSAP